MRVCIPIAFQPHGGGHYFIQALSAYLTQAGCAVSSDLASRYDVLFTNHWMVSRPQILFGVRHNPHVRIVQRIDGAAQDYGRSAEADTRQHEVNLVADVTIFQSQYCRYSTRQKFPVIVQDGPVIHNPVDVGLFCPEGRRLSLPGSTRVACVTWSTNPHKGSASLWAVAQQHPELRFILCGRYPDAPPLPNLHSLGVLAREELAAALRSCHMLLTFSENEACPNHVLEALASGLPVLYGDSGAMAEVTGEGGLPVTVETFSRQLQQVLDNHAQLSSKARERAVFQFHPDRIFPLYLEAIGTALASPLAVPYTQRLLLSWVEPVRWRVARLAQKVNGMTRLHPAARLIS